ncbi:MAG: aminoacyl-tRNA hydrolase [Burkholderiales bacterium]
MGAIRLIVGLGNPGREHERDRHNVGFWLVERLAAAMRVGLARESRYHALVGRASRPGGDAWLILPQTYMNLSGKAVGALARFYKIEPEEILAVHDELDFPPGTVKMKLGGGVAGHNGLKDIAAQIGTPNYWRIRIGIGHPGDRDLVGDYVLSSPSPADRALIDDCIARGIDVIPQLLSGEFEAAMLKLHTKPGSERPKPPRPAILPVNPGESKAKE